MEKMNISIRDYLKETNVKQWELANSLNIGETTLVRRLRKELPENEKNEILNAISKLSKEKE